MRIRGFNVVCAASLWWRLAVSCVRAGAISHRYDLDWSSLELGVPRYQRAPSQEATAWDRPSRRQQTIEPGSILLDFSCTSTDDALPRQTSVVSITDEHPPPLASDADTLCVKAHQTFLRGIYRLAKVLYFREPITILASVHSFCPYPDSPSCAESRRTLGSAGPAAWHTFNSDYAAELGVDANYSYPSALARQYVPDEVPDGEDIGANFNADGIWWFPTVENRDGKPEADWMDRSKVYDFEQAVIHELMHGLGFISSWYTWYDDTVLLPSYLDASDSGEFLGLATPYIFNKWMADAATGTWMSEYEQNITAILSDLAEDVKQRGWTWDQNNYAIMQEVRSSAAWEVGKHVMNGPATTLGRVAYWFPWRIFVSEDDEVTITDLRYAVLYTPTRFDIGSTLSHMDADFYQSTSEFLMRPYATAGTGLDGYRPVTKSLFGMKGEWMDEGPIGEAVLAIFRSMGYATALGPLV
ncbi:hypothetical protein BC832DRAFT_421180 [Gaertneriomyces semiglobifer]|nr:hypothetical protein BC832DRAFT_421180 [Gaertneriomyces semiglobifer]